MTLTDHDLETRLRHDLGVVAAAVGAEPVARRPRRRRRWLTLGAGVVVVPVLQSTGERPNMGVG